MKEKDIAEIAYDLGRADNYLAKIMKIFDQAEIADDQAHELMDKLKGIIYIKCLSLSQRKQ